MTAGPSKRLVVSPFDVARTFAFQRVGLGDPTARITETVFEKSWHDASGPSSLLVRKSQGGMEVAWRGAVTTDAFEGWASPDDGHADFVPRDRLLIRLHHVHRGLRIVRVPWMFDVACGAVMQQRVQFRDAARGFARLARTYGEPAPDGRVRWPTPERLAGLASWSFPSLGIDPRRGRALQMLARGECRRPFLTAQQDFESLRKRLLAIHGIGPWTTEMILGFGAGDPDALPLGDLHLPRHVAWAFNSPQTPSDAHMIELLEPYRGHRFRVVRLIISSLRHLRDPRADR